MIAEALASDMEALQRRLVIAVTSEELLVLGLKDCEIAAVAKIRRPAGRMAI
jgi:hypothetical protein